MPYTTVSGSFEQASRLGHTQAVVRALAERSSFYVPAEHLQDLAWLQPKVRSKSDLPRPADADLDLPLAGAYLRQGMSIQKSWREALDTLFRAKRIEVNRLDQSLLQLLMLLHGLPGAPAATLQVDCPHSQCRQRDIAVGASGVSCPGCGGICSLPTRCASTRKSPKKARTKSR
ncbi:MAG TPA: hypothetical protein VLW50_17805 [Streptosporangiaceae bacterium]|nr:hypothetical protein [Streptosporangiaceae bacterium]